MKFLLGKKRPRAATETDGGSNKDSAGAGSSSGAASSEVSGPRVVVHYPSTEPFPFYFDKRFPAEQYRSRVSEVKTAVHWGQRKLFLSELQLLTMFAKPGVTYHIVYAGSAPGTHLKCLDDLFGNIHTWELVDPGSFDRPVLQPLPNFNLRNEFFTNGVAYGIAARRMSKTPALRSVYEYLTLFRQDDEADKPTAAELLQKQLKDNIGELDVARSTLDIPSMYEPPKQLPPGLQLLSHVAMEATPCFFISDIRSGSPVLPNFEEHVAENMKAQQSWTEIIQADYSLLKFRLPYTSTRGTAQSQWLGKDGTVMYLNGEVLLPLWTRPTSTEGRQVVKAGALQRKWDVAHYENQCFYFNAVVRERMHFNHILSPHLNLDNHFDGAAEVKLWELFIEHTQPEILGDVAKMKSRINELVDLVSKECKNTFDGAIANRDRIILSLANGSMQSAFGHDDDAEEAAGLQQQQQEQHQLTDGKKQNTNWESQARAMIAAAKKERRRPIWLRNVDEARLKDYVPPPTQPPFEEQLWCAVHMPQS